MTYFKSVLVISMLITSSAGAEIMVDLPALSGDYSIGDNSPVPAPWSRTTTFTFPDSLENVEGLRFVTVGYWTNAQLETCMSVGGGLFCDTTSISTNVTLKLTADVLGACWLSASVNAFHNSSGSQMVVEFCYEGAADVDLLPGEEVTVELFCDVEPEILSRMVEAGYGAISSVQLGVYGPVHDMETSWGSLKSTFR